MKNEFNKDFDNMEEAIVYFKQCWSCAHVEEKDDTRIACDLNLQGIFSKKPHDCKQWVKRDGIVFSVRLRSGCKICNTEIPHVTTTTLSAKNRIQMNGESIYPVCGDCFNRVYTAIDGVER